MNKFFANIGTDLANKIPHVNFNFKISNPKSMFLSDVTIDEIYKKITALKNDKVPGSDNVPIKLIKTLNPIICKPLAYIYNLSFKTGPWAWGQPVTAAAARGLRSGQVMANQEGGLIGPDTAAYADASVQDLLISRTQWVTPQVTHFVGDAGQAPMSQVLMQSQCRPPE